MHSQFGVRKSNATQRSQCHATEIEHAQGNRFVEMQENEPFSPEAGEGRGRSRGGRPGVAGYGDGRARRGGLAWRATATATGERAEAAVAGDGDGRARGGGRAWRLGWHRGGWSRGLGFIFRLGWSLASI